MEHYLGKFLEKNGYSDFSGIARNKQFLAYESIRRLRGKSWLEADWDCVLVHLSDSFFRDWTLVQCFSKFTRR